METGKGNKWLVLHVNLTLHRCHIVKCHTLCWFPLLPSLSHPNKESPCTSSKGTWLTFLDTDKQRTWWSQSFVKMCILGHLAWCFLGYLFFCGKEKSQSWLPKLHDLNVQDFLTELSSEAESYLHLVTHMCSKQMRDKEVWLPSVTCHPSLSSFIKTWNPLGSTTEKGSAFMENIPGFACQEQASTQDIISNLSAHFLKN